VVWLDLLIAVHGTLILPAAHHEGSWRMMYASLTSNNRWIEPMSKVDVVTAMILGLVLSGCVSGAPTLTLDQYAKLNQISTFKPGDTPPKEYRVLSDVSGADCSGAPAGGRVWGTSENAIRILVMKAAALNADAVINVTCGAVPMLNNCWAAQKCSGTAVAFQ
jgi:hypothetical protein